MTGLQPHSQQQRKVWVLNGQTHIDEDGLLLSPKTIAHSFGWGITPVRFQEFHLLQWCVQFHLILFLDDR